MSPSQESNVRRISLLGWQRWRRLAGRAGAVQLRVLLWAIYYLSVVPLALLARKAVGKTIGGAGGAWVAVAAQDDSIESLRRQH